MTSSAHLQREADAARVGLADTLGQLRDGMAPSALSGEALSLAKDTGLSLIKSLSEQARANPVPALLIGAGLVMLLTRTTGGDVASVAGSALKSAASTGADAARHAAGAAGHAMKGAASAAAGAASSAATAAGDAVLDAADRAATSVSQRAGALRERVGGEVEAASDTVSGRYADMRDKMHDAADQGRRTLHDRQDQADHRGDAGDQQDGNRRRHAGGDQGADQGLQQHAERHDQQDGAHGHHHQATAQGGEFLGELRPCQPELGLQQVDGLRQGGGHEGNHTGPAQL